MEIKVEDVLKIFQELLSGQCSRDEADRIAWSLRSGIVERVHHVVPREDEDRIWSALKFLHGIDLRHGEGQPYLDGLEAIQKEMEKLVKAGRS